VMSRMDWVIFAGLTAVTIVVAPSCRTEFEGVEAYHRR
jgi:hypothetical protein